MRHRKVACEGGQLERVDIILNRLKHFVGVMKGACLRVILPVRCSRENPLANVSIAAGVVEVAREASVFHTFFQSAVYAQMHRLP